MRVSTLLYIISAWRTKHLFVSYERFYNGDVIGTPNINFIKTEPLQESIDLTMFSYE